MVNIKYELNVLILHVYFTCTLPSRVGRYKTSLIVYVCFVLIFFEFQFVIRKMNCFSCFTEIDILTCDCYGETSQRNPIKKLFGRLQLLRLL